MENSTCDPEQPVYAAPPCSLGRRLLERMGTLPKSVGGLMLLYVAFWVVSGIGIWMSGDRSDDLWDGIWSVAFVAGFGWGLFRLGSACFRTRGMPEPASDEPSIQRRELLGVVLLAALLTLGCDQTPAGSIERVLNRCAKLSAKVNASEMTAGEAADYLAREMQKIDTRNCPAEFRTTFQEHANAWRNAAPWFAANTPLTGFLEGLAAGASGDSSAIGFTRDNAAVAAMNINDTYNRLVVVAVSHGARVPVSEVRK